MIAISNVIKKAKDLSVIFILISISIIFMFPVLVTITNSFMTGFEIINRYNVDFNAANSFDKKTNIHMVEMNLIPTAVSLKQYFKLLFDKPLYLGLFWNSVRLTSTILFGQLLISAPAAFYFYISKFKYKEILFFLYVVIMIMPLQVTLVPNYIVADFLNIKESYLAIILPSIFSPFGVFLIRQFFSNLPYEYIEAAMLDGANRFDIFRLVIVPIIKPVIAALAILVFIENWNMVDQAVIFIAESIDEPLSVYLSRLRTDNIDMIFAASCFYMLPTLLVFLYGQEHLVEGIQLSGIK